MAEPGPGYDRPLHEICRGRALHKCLSRRDVRSCNQHLNSKTWLSDDVSIGQWNSFCWRIYKRANETFSGGPTSFHDIPSPDQWLSGEAKSDAGVDAEGILFPVNDRLGQVASTEDGSLEQHAALHHRFPT